MVSGMSSREELKRFLSASRARIDPAALGLTVNRRRRSPGLTREQVAELAGVSAHWYARFEAGARRRSIARSANRGQLRRPSVGIWTALRSLRGQQNLHGLLPVRQYAGP